MKVFSIFVAVAAIIVSIDGFKVLAILPFGSASHFTIGNSIVQALLESGNQVTVISPYPHKKPLKNHRDISIADALEKHQKENDINLFDIGNLHPMLSFLFLYKMGSDLVHIVMQHPEIEKLLESNEKFDVCIHEVFNADALVGFVDRFDCVLISYTTFGAVKWINDMTSNQMKSSYVPHPMLHYTDKMSFSERFENTYMSLAEDFFYHALHLPNQKRLYNKYFPNAKRPFNEMYKSSAIIFLNNHVSSSSPRPYLPNMIEIGGIHVKDAKPLPKDIQKFLDSAKEGVILFSMGSLLKSKNWPVDKREAFVSAFGKIKQKVLWKYENDTLPNKPDNVMIHPWIPQRDILAHPNVKLFITHGGLLGTTEAVVEGVPILGIPVYGDQKMNMAKAVAREYGLQINLDDVSEQNVLAALTELLSNPKYSQNAKELSNRFIDRPMKIQDQVVYWVEYALRHKGAHHLRASGNNLNFFEFHLLDVYAILAVFGFVFFFVSYLILKLILKKIFKKKNVSADKKRK